MGGYNVLELHRRLNQFLIDNNVQKPELLRTKAKMRHYCRITNKTTRAKTKRQVKEYLAVEFGFVDKKPKSKRPKKSKKVLIVTRSGKTKSVTERKKAYLEYLDSSKWKNLRKELLKERGEICQKCTQSKPTRFLHVHHMTYERLFNEEKTDLMILCKGCHKEVHAMPRKNNPYFI